MLPPVETLSAPKYSRVPWEVLSDPRLKPRDICIYAVLSSVVWQGNYACIGSRLIREGAHTSARRVSESLWRLEKYGHIKRRDDVRRGQRQGYMLTSPVFAKKQGKVDEVIAHPSGRRRLVSVRATA